MRLACFIILVSINIFNVIGQNSRIDSTIVMTDSATIYGEKYRAIYRTDEFLYILDSKDIILFRSRDYYPDFEFVDFDKDGLKELMINYLSNIPAIKDLIKFDINSKMFIPIEKFDEYPDPKSINGTKYFYSYHRSGCADMNWDSDLFYIENFKTIKIGSIAGRECEDMDEKDGIYIYKIVGDTKVNIKTLPIGTINEFKDNKWGFIMNYWSRNYQYFE
jgi:hypothetical protein